jgi:Na+-translocating ferredoxin:NAD+ oxidoreductase subunit G
MDSVKSFLQQAWLVLMLAVVLGGSLAVVERSLEAKIAENAAARLERAILDVVPEGSSSELTTLGDVTVHKVVADSGNTVGWAVAADTMGYADKIKLLVGITADASRISGIAILDSKETPGLGEEMRKDDFRNQFKDKPADKALSVVKTGATTDTEIDSLTGATITSKAVTNAINDQLKSVRDKILAATDELKEL